MNCINFTGHLPRDSEQKFTPNGDAVLTFSVALNSGFGAKSTTSWMNCTMWGKRSESVAPYLKKGTLVGITGEFAARVYQNKEGVEKTSLDVRVNDLTFLGKSEHESTAPVDKSVEKRVEKKAAAADFDDFESEIPF